MTIYGVQNPPSIGGTAQFYIQTFQGTNLIDQSLIAGILGIGGAIGTMTSTTVAIDSRSSSAAGDSSNYIFSFRTDVDLPQNVYFQLQLPINTFGVSTYPSCSSFPINGVQINGTFSCSYDANAQSIAVTGVAQAIPAGMTVGISVSMRNPTYSYTTGTFNIYAMKLGTTLAFTRMLGIKGVPITAGAITQISMNPIDSLFVVSMIKTMWFSLSFKLKNPLISGSMITIALPNSISIAPLSPVEGISTTYYVQSGLNDINGNNPLSITAAGNLISITNFQSMSQPNLITVNILLVTPPSSGPSSPIQITSYTDISGTSRIDQDVATATVQVSNIRKLLQSNASWYHCALHHFEHHFRRRN